MDSSITLRTGKYAGKTIGWVEENDRGYLLWVKENRPEMLKEIKKQTPKPQPKIIEISEEHLSAMKPNMNFWNEGPDKLSLPYLNKIKEEFGT